jgi:hypothetical protein
VKIDIEVLEALGVPAETILAAYQRAADREAEEGRRASAQVACIEAGCHAKWCDCHTKWCDKRDIA